MSIHLYQRDGERYRDFLHRLRDHRSKITRERRREADMVRRARLPTPDDSDSDSDASDCVLPEYLFPVVRRVLRPSKSTQRQPTHTFFAASSDYKHDHRLPRRLQRAASPPPRPAAELPRLRPRPWRLQSSTAVPSTAPIPTPVVSRKRKRGEDDVPQNGDGQEAAPPARKQKRVSKDAAQSNLNQSAPLARKRKRDEDEDVHQSGRRPAKNGSSVVTSVASADTRTLRIPNSKRRRDG